MRIIRNTFLFTLLIISNLNLSAQEQWGKYAHLFTVPNTYVAGYSSHTITIDGQASEQDWKDAA